MQIQSAASKASCRPCAVRSSRVAAFTPACVPSTGRRATLARCPVQQQQLSQPSHVTFTAAMPAPPSVENGKHISSTEVPPFIPRDDLVDQIFRWSIIEAGEGGQRNFGLPMKVEPTYHLERLWGFNVSIYKEGVKLTELGIFFDKLNVPRHAWVGKGEDGFPMMEGKMDDVLGKNLEIWKLDSTPVTEDLRSAIRAYCTGLVGALNRYYAFGSVFVDDAQ